MCRVRSTFGHYMDTVYIWYRFVGCEVCSPFDLVMHTAGCGLVHITQVLILISTSNRAELHVRQLLINKYQDQCGNNYCRCT